MRKACRSSEHDLRIDSNDSPALYRRANSALRSAVQRVISHHNVYCRSDVSNESAQAIGFASNFVRFNNSFSLSPISNHSVRHSFSMFNRSHFCVQPHSALLLAHAVQQNKTFDSTTSRCGFPSSFRQSFQPSTICQVRNGA